MEKTVFIVHAIDVEGPMTETLEATFERMKAYGLPENVEVSQENLEMIQAGRFNGIEKDLSSRLKRVFNKWALSYLTHWDQIDEMIRRVTAVEFRNEHKSKDGEPYVFSWFIYDHHDDFTNNPRFHEVGTHKIFDHYMEKLRIAEHKSDGIYWHYHPPSISGDALESNTSWSNHTTHEQIISRRIIERNWYFSVFRAGLHLERNDLSHWMEMFIPFDFSARYDKDNFPYAPGLDFDWRNCSSRWGAWHPDWYDYRNEGSMKRHLFRCTDLYTYFHQLNHEEVEEAFLQADEYGSSILTYYNHDYRDMEFEIRKGYEVIQEVASKYPGINFVFVNALEAAQKHLNLNPSTPKLEYHLKSNLLTVKSDNQIFGPQPFLAIQEGNDFFRDNFTDEGNNTWAYQFRKLNNVKAFGVAANSPEGMHEIIVHNF